MLELTKEIFSYSTMALRHRTKFKKIHLLKQITTSFTLKKWFGQTSIIATEQKSIMWPDILSQ